MAIRFFDMFAGIGGFRSGLEAVGGFECVGHCEIDKYANQAYNAMYDTEPCKTCQVMSIPNQGKNQKREKIKRDSKASCHIEECKDS